MKKDRITKLYDGLNPKELGALAFERCMFQDEIEVDRILAAVPIKTYNCLDYRYGERLNGCHLITLYYGMYYWQYSCQYSASVGIVIHPDVQPNKRKEALECSRDAQEKLLAIGNALNIICDKYGISMAAVRQQTGCKPFKPTDEDMEPDGETYDGMMALFETIMKRAE